MIEKETKYPFNVCSVIVTWTRQSKEKMYH